MADEEATEATKVLRSPLSRRNVLKGVGVGVTAVWAAPTIMSLGSVAHAASAHPPLACQDCNPAGDPCSNQTACGDSDEGCSCKTTAAGGSCLCTTNGQCVDFTACPNGDRDCPSGFSCVASCCNDVGFGNLCLPNCGNAAAVPNIRKSGSGPRTDRR
jgi:hypothetical protein